MNSIIIFIITIATLKIFQQKKILVLTSNETFQVIFFTYISFAQTSTLSNLKMKINFFFYDIKFNFFLFDFLNKYDESHYQSDR